MSTWQDDVLGADFQQLILELPHGKNATLVRYTGPATQQPVTSLTGADVLYLHGWSDYFFQRELAEFWHAAGANFYALDLHGYGRSMVPGHHSGEISDLLEYDADLAAALSAMGREVVEDGGVHESSESPVDFDENISSEPHPGGPMAWIAEAVAALALRRQKVREPVRRPLVLLGHSTGGLIFSLWAARHPSVADALILNSPWLEFQGSEVGRAVMGPILGARNRFRPFAPMPGIDPGFYARAVSSRFEGEWDYNPDWRPDRGFPVNAAFLRAVFAGQATIARGLDLAIPVLVMLSDKSYLQPRWSGTALAADVVLNVDAVARRALDLGPDVTMLRISGAFHDIFLSRIEIRGRAYEQMGRWVDSSLDTELAKRWESGSFSQPATHN